MAWFAFDVDDYDADTMHLTVCQDGIYMRLLRHYYKTRMPLPDNDVALAAISRIDMDQWTANKVVILRFFRSRRGKLVHKRCNAELDREDALCQKRSKHAQNAALKRWSISKTKMLRASSEHAQAMLNDATKPDQTSKKNATPLPESSIDKPNAITGPVRKKSGNGLAPLRGSVAGNGKFSDQQARDEYAVAACVPFLPGRDDGERWTIAMAAEDPRDPNHVAACLAMRLAAKKAHVGWISPERRKPAHEH